MRMTRCMECGILTYQKDQQCVICKIGLRQMHSELLMLLLEDGNIGLRLAAQKQSIHSSFAATAPPC